MCRPREGIGANVSIGYSLGTYEFMFLLENNMLGLKWYTHIYHTKVWMLTKVIPIGFSYKLIWPVS